MIKQPLFRDCWLYKNNLNLNNDKLKSIIYEFEKNRQNKEISVASLIKSNLSESSLYFFEECNHDYITKLKLCIVAEVKQCIKELFIDAFQDPVFIDDNNINITESWYHITQYGGYHDVHNHNESGMSGIYYVSVDECTSSSGANRFYRPFNSVADESYGPLKFIMSDLNFEVPTNGKIIMFPGFLNHSAIPYYGKSDRIIIGFNINLK